MTGKEIIIRGRIMAFDLGQKRIGVSMSDECGLIANALKTIKVNSKDKSIDQILGLIKQYNPVELVVGLPLNMNGSVGPAARMCQHFAEKLKEASGLKVSLWDERLTTVWADKSLIEHNVRRSRRREVIDRVAAVILLQSYLESIKDGE